MRIHETALPVSLVPQTLFQLAAMHLRIQLAGVLSMKGVDENAQTAIGDAMSQPGRRQPKGAGDPERPTSQKAHTGLRMRKITS
jgi:hypothetical protein